MANSPPMIRRRSNRFAARASRSVSRSWSAWASACSVSLMSSSRSSGWVPVLSVAMSLFLPLREDEAQDRRDAERPGSQRRGLAVPGALRPALVLLLVRHAVHEALELLDGLRLGEQGDADADDGVDRECD